MRTTIVIDEKLMKKIRLEAIERGNLKAVSQIISEAIEFYFEKKKKK